MSIEEQLAKLNAKSQSFDSTGGSFGAMTVADLCAALAGCDPIGEMIIRRKYVDPKERGLGYVQLLKETIILIYGQGLEPKKKNMIDSILEIAIDDYIGNFKCDKCEGRGVIIQGGIAKKCTDRYCHDGKRQRFDYERAKALDISKRTYERQYKRVYGHISDYLTKTIPEKENAAIRLILRQAKWHD